MHKDVCMLATVSWFCVFVIVVVLDLRMALWLLDNFNGNPYNIWLKVGKPDFPSLEQQKSMRDQEVRYYSISVHNYLVLCGTTSKSCRIIPYWVTDKISENQMDMPQYPICFKILDQFQFFIIFHSLWNIVFGCFLTRPFQ